jgi:uncharacterized protein
MHIWLWILAILLVFLGLAGTVLPLLPGVPLVFAGLLIAAWIDDFAKVGMPALVALGLLTLLSLTVDIAASSAGAGRAGAGRAALVGAAVGAFAGLFFGLPGLIAGPFLGAALGQLFVQRDLAAAGRAGTGAVVGLLLGALAKLALAVIMIATFVAAYLI